MRKSSWLLSLAMVAGLVGLVGGPASAQATHWVNDDVLVGGNTSCADPGYNTIQAAVTAAVAGDTIEVCTGAYNESVIINKALTLLGAKAGVAAGPDETPAGRGADESVVTGTSASSIFEVRSTSTIDGFTFVSDPTSTAARGIYIRSSAPGTTVVNNLVRFGSGDAPTGPVAAAIMGQNFRGHTISWNNVQGYRYGIYADGDNDVDQSTVEGNYVGSNSTTGIFVSGNKPISHLFVDNVIEGSGNGILTTSAHEFSGNTVRNNTHGIRLWGTAFLVGAQVLGNDILDNVQNGIWLSPNHADAMDNEAHENNIVGNGTGIRNQHAALFDAECNWYGSLTGPMAAGNPSGTGDSVVEDPGVVDYTPWLIAPAPGGECEGPLSPMDHKQMVRDELEAMLPTGDKKDDKEIEKAIAKIDKSLDPELWVDDETLDPKDGKKVFDEEKKAVKHLEKVDTVDVSGQIDALVGIDRQLAENAMEDADEAIAAAAGGDPKKLEKAQKERDKADEELAKGDEERADGDNDKAIDKYKKAWEKAQKAIKHANKA